MCGTEARGALCEFQGCRLRLKELLVRARGWMDSSTNKRDEYVGSIDEPRRQGRLNATTAARARAGEEEVRPRGIQR